MTDQRQTVVAFLERCNAYARASIERKEARGDIEDIPKWEAYIEFNEHAIGEINDGTLDRWFSTSQQLPPPTQRLSTDAMEHVERSTWLNATLTPRPVVIAVTLDEQGVRNASPVSSLMSVSTAPPYLTASFSIHRDGRHRDTLVNARATAKIVFNILPATERAVHMVDECATPLPAGQDESSLADIEYIDDGMVMREAVAAIEATYIDEHALPDAVAKLAVFRAEAIWTGLENTPEHGLNVLCQHGRDLMTPAPNGWNQRVTKHYGTPDKDAHID